MYLHLPTDVFFAHRKVGQQIISRHSTVDVRPHATFSMGQMSHLSFVMIGQGRVNLLTGFCRGFIIRVSFRAFAGKMAQCARREKMSEPKVQIKRPPSVRITPSIMSRVIRTRNDDPSRISVMDGDFQPITHSDLADVNDCFCAAPLRLRRFAARPCVHVMRTSHSSR